MAKKTKTKKKTSRKSSFRTTPLSHLMPQIFAEIIKPRIDACFSRYPINSYRDLAEAYLTLFEVPLSVGIIRDWAKSCGYEFRASLTPSSYNLSPLQVNDGLQRGMQIAGLPTEVPPFAPRLPQLVAPHAEKEADVGGFDNRKEEAPLFLHDPGNTTRVPDRLNPLPVDALGQPGFDPSQNPLNLPVATIPQVGAPAEE